MSKKKLKRMSKHFTKPKFQSIRFEAPNIPLRERLTLMKEFGQTAETQYHAALQDLHAGIIQTNPIVVLCSLSHAFLMSHEGRDNEWNQEDPILQHHLELLQSLILKHSWAEYKLERTDPEPIISLLKDVSWHNIQRRARDLDPNATESSLKSRLVKEDVRIHTQAVRNWGYPQHILDVTKRLLLPLDDKFAAHHGVNTTACVDFLFDVVKEIEQRASLLMNALIRCYREKNKRKMFESYSEVFSFDPNLDYTSKLIDNPSVSLKDFRNHLFVCYDRLIAIVYRVTAHQLADLRITEGDQAKLLLIVKQWSIPFGGITVSDDHLFMGSPIRTKPFIEVKERDGESSFLLPLPGLLISFCLQMIEQLLTTDDLKAAYFKQRSSFLESEVVALLLEKFPSGKVYSGSQWRCPDDGVLYENDALVLVDSTAIICEAKSGRMDDPARRGSDGLKDEINKLKADPAVQATRFANYLAASPGVHHFDTKRGEVNNVDTTHVRAIIPISITLEDLAMRGTWGDLKAAGMVDQAVPESPSFMLGDFLVIMDVLELEAQRLHYLQRRASFKKHIRFVGDEVDMLALYLKTRLWFDLAPDTEYSGIGEGTVFNDYYTRTFEGLPATKPVMPLTDRWQSLITRIQDKQQPGWSRITDILLNVSFQNQTKIEKAIQRLSRRIRKAQSTCEQIVFHQPGLKPSEALIIFLHASVKNSELKIAVASALENALIQTNADSAVAIAIDAQNQSLLYSGPLASEHKRLKQVSVCVPS